MNARRGMQQRLTKVRNSNQLRADDWLIEKCAAADREKKKQQDLGSSEW